MTKQELAQKVAADAGLAGAQAKSAVDAAFDAIASELAAGRDVAIAGFGKFSGSERSARDGPNPFQRRNDPDRCQYRREVLSCRGAEKAAQQLTLQPPC
jgi:nucleoid DNA-binding protein